MKPNLLRGFHDHGKESNYIKLKACLIFFIFMSQVSAFEWNDMVSMAYKDMARRVLKSHSSNA